MIFTVRDLKNVINAFDENLEIIIEIVDTKNNLLVGRGCEIRFIETNTNSANQLIFRNNNGEDTLHRYRWSTALDTNG